ncbi:hypothetical protein [Agrobacterium tumefaciens]|uniref:hypothetical protein n=1 Tax=Agrobacterium tumefaciens TaxID=358 RepID=UPI003BA305ED
MPAIFTTEGTAINSEHVVKYTELRNGQTRFLLSTGDVETAEVVGDIEDAFYPIVPANPGHAAVFVDQWEGEFHYRIRSIIAWRVCPGGNFPFFATDGDHLDNYEALIDPLGGVSDDEGNTGMTLVEWKGAFESRVLAGQKEAA